jgi:hypothetical protein
VNYFALKLTSVITEDINSIVLVGKEPGQGLSQCEHLHCDDFSPRQKAQIQVRPVNGLLTYTLETLMHLFYIVYENGYIIESL